jgi:hypothetical protein
VGSGGQRERKGERERAERLLREEEWAARGRRGWPDGKRGSRPG